MKPGTVSFTQSVWRAYDMGGVTFALIPRVENTTGNEMIRIYGNDS